MGFKIGDKVRVMSSNPRFDGTEGTIAEIGCEDLYHVVFVDGSMWAKGKKLEAVKKFKVEDRIKFIDKLNADNLYGSTGRIVVINGNKIGVEFDKYMGGHDCGGHGKTGHCWWVLENEIEITEEYEPFEQEDDTEEEQQEAELKAEDKVKMIVDKEDREKIIEILKSHAETIIREKAEAEDREVAIELVKAWAGTQGQPVDMEDIIATYSYTIKRLKKERKK